MKPKRGCCGALVRAQCRRRHCPWPFRNPRLDQLANLPRSISAKDAHAGGDAAAAALDKLFDFREW